MNRNEFKPANRESRRLSESAWRWGVVILALGYLWFRLINNLWLEWNTNPQYGYGLLVPFLCLGLLIRRWHGFTENRKQKVEKERGKAESRKQPGEVASPLEYGKDSMGHGNFTGQGKQKSTVLFFALLAFLYLPTRLIEASTPEWRPIQWLLGIEAIGLTLCAIDLGKGRGWLRQLAFPILFFFVAIPWPTLVEQPIIQALTRASAVIVIELLGWVGVPALAHGNVIEVATGMVGIDEACSGIRSFQSSLMISLFFGEFYALSRSRRWLLVPAGFVFSMAFNVCRMVLLTLIAAKKGVPAISQYHDPAGVTIAIACTVALWGLAILLRSPKSKVQSPKLEEGESRATDHGLRMTEKENIQHPTSNIQHPISHGLQDHGTTEKENIEHPTSNIQHPISHGLQDHGTTDSDLRPPISEPQNKSETTKVACEIGKATSRAGENKNEFLLSAFPISAFKSVRGLAISLLIWLVLVEAGVQLWYRHLESQLKPGPSWSAVFPEVNPTFRVLPIGEKEKYLLRFDEGKQAAWTESDGTQWDVFYCSWLPGRVAGYLAKRHTPEICLQATGLKMVSGPELIMMNVHGVELPVRSYVFNTAGGPINVFHCRWEAGVKNSTYVQHESARFNLIRGIWAGRGNKGQKVLEIIISGCEDSEQAKQALGRELEKMIKIVP